MVYGTKINKFLGMLLISSIPCLSSAYSCKISHSKLNDTFLYGSCSESKGDVFFYSCLGFTCKTNIQQMQKLSKTDPSCASSVNNIIDLTIKEHGSLEKVPFCPY
jgi:hypothetical protein